MSASVIEGPVRMGDYETSTGTVLYNNSGPKMQCCGRTRKECDCPRKPEIPGDDRNENPIGRQATALEMIAFQLGKIVKHLEAKPAPVPEPEVEIRPVMLAATDVAMPPVLTPEKIAENESKKAATLERLKGAK